MPQAWAAGSVFLMLQASLGVMIDAVDGVVAIDHPCLPSGLDRLNVTGLRAGESRFDLMFEHSGGGVAVQLRHKHGPEFGLRDHR